MIRLLTVVLTIFLMLATSSVTFAKQLYKYQDEDGVWHFSDKPPKTDLPVEVRPARVDPKPRLDMRKLGLKNKPDYWFYNRYDGPLELEVAFLAASNITSDPPLPQRFILEPREEARLVKVRPVDPAKAWDFQLTYRWVPGDPGASHMAGVRYLPPFPAGKTFWITQGSDDRETHVTADSMYAVDIALPEGTPVLAARSGLVMDIEDDFFTRGKNRERFGDRANIVRILHEDGTMAIYAHLQLDSIRVAAGSVVLTGEQIARSGNTGYSSGPHLHFAIQRNAGMQLESLPFVFMGEGDSSIRPLSRMQLDGVGLRRATTNRVGLIKTQ